MTRNGWLVAVGALAVVVGLTLLWTRAAAQRPQEAAAADGAGTERVAVAAASDAEYCSPALKKILRRVLQSCGLIGRSGARGCQPLEAKEVANLSSADFNALFLPMRTRGGIVLYDVEGAELDPTDYRLIEDVFSDQRGASYFFVVARSSLDGPVEFNRDLSQKRAEAVLDYLEERFEDPDLHQEVGLLWLGEEFAQLDRDFCGWRRSGVELAAAEASRDACRTTDLNRGAFISWIDCRL